MATKKKILSYSSPIFTHFRTATAHTYHPTTQQECCQTNLPRRGTSTANSTKQRLFM